MSTVRDLILDSRNLKNVLYWKNTSGEIVPAYGTIRLISYSSADRYYNAIKPDGEVGLYFVNGPSPVAVNAFGESKLWNTSLPGRTQSAAYGDVVGPVAYSWDMTPDGAGWTVFNNPVNNVSALLKNANVSHIRHGIVTTNHGCGYYTIEKAEWIGDRDTAGIGLGSGSGIGDCDPCYDVVGEGTEACGITLTYPPLQVTGIGEYVTAFDEASQLIPLVVGTSCKMIDMGDRIGGSASGSGSDNGEPCWQILRGVMNHTVQYKITDDDCCDASGQTGTYTVLQKTPIILIGKECSPINCGSCDPGSGS